MSQNIYDERWQIAKDNAQNPSFEIVELGWEQHVLIDHDKGIVYRYPRNNSASAKLSDEVAVLANLNKATWPIFIPKMLDHKPEYTSYEYIDGEVLEPSLLASLSIGQLENIGSKLGEFLAALHKQDMGLVNRKATKQTSSLYEYYKVRIESSKPSKEFSQAWIDFSQLSEPSQNNRVVVHGDLHGLNMVVDRASKELIGVIDFSELEIGDPHQDFRKIFMTRSQMLSPAIDSYRKAGGAELLEETVKLWAYANEWANICYFKNQPKNITYQRAYSHLKEWGRIN